MRRSWGEEPRVSARPEASGHDSSAAANPDALLGALSFSSSREPISVSADGLEFNYRTRVLVYKGGVVAVQGDMKLESNTLTVSLSEHAQNQVKQVVAEGDVRLTKGTRWATGGRAVFDQAQNTVVLSQNAVVHDGTNEVSGEQVVVYLDQERSVVEGGSGRVKAVLYPSKSEVAGREQTAGAAPPKESGP